MTAESGLLPSGRIAAVNKNPSGPRQMASRMPSPDLREAKLSSHARTVGCAENLRPDPDGLLVFRGNFAS